MVGQRIKKYRKQKRMSQAELAASLGLSQGAISQWENGGSKPDINMIKSMAEMFGVSVLDLTGDVDVPAIALAQEKGPAERRTEAEMLLKKMNDAQYARAVAILKLLQDEEQ